MKVRTIFMGTPQFAVPILESLLRGPYHVVAVYSQVDKLSGRGRQIAWSPVKKLAVEQKIPVVQRETLKSKEAVEELASFKSELMVVAAFGHILPQEVLSLHKFGCLNVHPSLLPRHRGPSPIANTLLCGDEVTGVTIMLMDDGVDSGPILAQREAAISPQDTSGSLAPKLARVGAELLLETLPLWVGGRIEPQPQDERYATFSKSLTKEDGEVHWSLPAVELWQRIRALTPWPSCYTWWQGKRLKIWEAIPLGDVAKGEVGKVVALPMRVGVVTGGGVLGLCQVQLEGKRQVPVEDFVRGQRGFIGSILG